MTLRDLVEGSEFEIRFPNSTRTGRILSHTPSSTLVEYDQYDEVSFATSGGETVTFSRRVKLRIASSTVVHPRSPN